MVDREEFINIAQNLDGSYTDYGRCVYSIAYNHNLLNEVFNYMTNKAKNTDDLDLFLFNHVYNPMPFCIVDDITEYQRGKDY